MISVDELIPQMSPMVLISGYEEPSAQNAVMAFVDVTPTSPFYELTLCGVPSCVSLEYMAQTMALLVGLSRRRKGLSPQIGFVLGSRRLEIFVPFFKKGARYRVLAECTYEDESFGSFDCEIRDAHQNLCARGTLTAYQPEGEMTPERLSAYA